MITKFAKISRSKIGTVNKSSPVPSLYRNYIATNTEGQEMTGLGKDYTHTSSILSGR